MNALTLLALVLVLGAIVGLVLRQLPNDAVGVQIDDDRGFSMTCPSSIRVTAGVQYEFTCVLTNESRYQEGVSVEPDDGDYIEQSGDGSYVLTGYGQEVVPSREYISARLFRPGEDRVRYASLSIQVNMRYNPLLYVGPGLLLVQAAMILIAPVIFLGTVQTSNRAGPKTAKKVFMTIDVLYLTYLAQFLLMSVFFFVFTWSRAGSPNLDNHHWVEFAGSMGVFLIFAWFIYYMRWQFFERRVSAEWRRWPRDDESTEVGSSAPSTGLPFTLAILAGLITCLVAFPVNAYWLGWLGNQ